MIIGQGKVSCFGGPHDSGVGSAEGLSCIEPGDLAEWWFSRCFGPQPAGTTGLARRLNPDAFYLAMRWHYGAENGIPGDILPGWTREQVRRAAFKVSANGKSIIAQAADWGPDLDPHDAAAAERVADLSPGIFAALSLDTDDCAVIEAL